MIILLLATAIADDGFQRPTTAVMGPMSSQEADTALRDAGPACPAGEYVIKYWVTPTEVEIKRDDSDGCLSEAVKRAAFPHHGGCSLVTQRVSFSRG